MVKAEVVGLGKKAFTRCALETGKDMGLTHWEIRRKLHLTQKDAVKLLSGGGHNAFSRYERGELAPPQPLFTLMRLLDRHPHLMAEVHALSEGADLKQLLATRYPEQETVQTQ